MDLKKTYEKRLSVLRTLIHHDLFSMEVFCSFYSISSQAVSQMLGLKSADMAKELESAEPISFATLRASLEKAIAAEKKEGCTDEAILEHYGLLRMPGETEYVRDTSRVAALLSAVYEKIDVPLVLNTAAQWLLSDDETSERVKTWLQTEPVYLVSKLTGLPKKTLVKFCRREGITPILSRTTDAQKGEYKMAVQSRTLSNQKREERQAKVWQEYSTGKTQQDVANELGLDRKTVGSYLRDYQAKHPEIVDPTQLYSKRNMGLDSMKRDRELVEDYDLLIDCGMNEADALTLLKTTKETLLRARITVGSADLSVTPAVNKTTKMESRIGFEKANKPAEWKKDWQGTVRLHKSPTSYILDKLKAPAPSCTDRSRERFRNVVLNSQRELMMKLRTDDNARAAWLESKGSISAAVNAGKEATAK